MTRARRLLRRPIGWLLGLAVGAPALGACAAFALDVDRGALWQVVRACVADARLTSLPFPCLAVDLAGGVARGHVVLRPPWSNDTILSPTRKITGVEDPFLQSGEAPNYFAAALRARTMVATANGRPPARDQIALIVNSHPLRGQDQLHIHIGCLVPEARRALAEAAPRLPLNAWRLIGAVVLHQPFWATRIRSRDLEGVNPFRLVYDFVGRALRDPGDVTVAVAGAKVDGEDDMLVLLSYLGEPGSWWPVGAEDLIDRGCAGEAIAGE